MRCYYGSFSNMMSRFNDTVSHPERGKIEILHFEAKELWLNKYFKVSKFGVKTETESQIISAEGSCNARLQVLLHLSHLFHNSSFDLHI